MIFLDDRLIDPEVGRIDPADRGFLLGDGLFETLQARDGVAPLLDRHRARLTAGAARLGIPLPPVVAAPGALAAAIRGVLAGSGLANAAAAIRITLSRGPGPRGLLPPPVARPTLLVAAAPLAPPPGPTRAVRVAIPRNERSPLATLKTLSCLDGVLARLEAAARGVDEAILGNTQGRLAEASAANLFLVTAGKAGPALVTPPPSEGALPGIARGLVLELAAALGLPAREAALPHAALDAATEAFLTNSLIGVRPLVAVDGRAVGAGEVGPVTRRLAEAFSARMASTP